MNFIEQAIAAGFKIIESSGHRSDVNYDPSSGWYGLTTYHPSETFTRGDKLIIISLVTSHQKEIVLINGQQLIYKSRGVVPSDEILNKFFE